MRNITQWIRHLFSNTRNKPRLQVPLTDGQAYCLSPSAQQVWQQAIHQAEQAYGDRLTTSFILLAMVAQQQPTSQTLQRLQRYIQDHAQEAYSGISRAYIYWYRGSGKMPKPPPVKLETMTDYCGHVLALAQQLASQEQQKTIHCRHLLSALLGYQPPAQRIMVGASYLLTSIGLSPSALLAAIH